MMAMPFTVKLPLDLVVEMRKKLEAVEALHAAEVARFEKKAKAGGDPAKLAVEGTALKERGKRITVHHLLRAMLMAGVETVDKKPGDLLKLMAEDTVKVGRPARGPRSVAA